MLKYNMACHDTLPRMEYVSTPDLVGQSFSLVSMGEFDCTEQYYTLRDGLSQGLLLYTRDGCGELEYQNARMLLPPGSLAVINCISRHHYRTSPGQRWLFRWIHFAGNDALQLESAINRDGPFVVTMPASAFDGYWDDIHDAAGGIHVSSGHMVALHLHRLLAEVMLRREQQLSVEHISQLPTIRAAVAYMHQNYARPLCIEEIARTVAMSKYHFIKLFARIMGTTPYQYLTLLRITEAKRLLVSTDRPVTAVALSTGYTDSKTFIRGFKNTVGMTPLQFRKSSLWMG